MGKESRIIVGFAHGTEVHKCRKRGSVGVWKECDSTEFIGQINIHNFKR